MKLKAKIYINTLLCLCANFYGQQQYNYKRELTGITDPWHKIVLPDELFNKVKPDLSDIRIYGVTANHDTIEAPYHLLEKKGKRTVNEIQFKTLNTSHNEKGYYFTFETPTKEPVNQIDLDFKQQNFDWKLNLEGSQDQREWFTIVENYRIVGIKNNLTDFKFVSVPFQNSSFRFFRILIDCKERPDLATAKILKHDVSEAEFNSYKIKTSKLYNNTLQQQTEIDIDLMQQVPVSYLKFKIKDNVDYSRHFTVDYLLDSFKTEQGWKYNYLSLSDGILNSTDQHEFNFNSTVLKKLRVIVQNHDNTPLNFDVCNIKGYVHEVVARFDRPASYFMVYGNNNVAKPIYDIDRFPEKLPENMTTLGLGFEQLIEKKLILSDEPLFKNKAWLWTVIILLIALLGWFSLRMMRKTQR